MQQQVQAGPAVRIRSALFFVAYNLMGVVHSSVSVLIAPFLSFGQRYRFVNLWTRASIWLLRHLNGVHVEVCGLENLPRDTPCVVIVNHQSQWETFYLQLLVCPQATVLKRELLWLPFFGWGLALLRPIAIDRGRATAALKHVLREGRRRLSAGTSVVIYPEGTRQPPGTLGVFNHGGALLAVQAGVPVVPMVHNSGDCWPARSLMRYPGTIRLVVGAPISSAGKDARTLNQEVTAWMERNYPQASAGSSPSEHELRCKAGA